MEQVSFGFYAGCEKVILSAKSKQSLLYIENVYMYTYISVCVCLYFLRMYVCMYVKAAFTSEHM